MQSCNSTFATEIPDKFYKTLDAASNKSQTKQDGEVDLGWTWDRTEA